MGVCLTNWPTNYTQGLCLGCRAGLQFHVHIENHIAGAWQSCRLSFPVPLNEESDCYKVGTQPSVPYLKKRNHHPVRLIWWHCSPVFMQSCRLVSTMKTTSRALRNSNLGNFRSEEMRACPRVPRSCLLAGRHVGGLRKSSEYLLHLFLYKSWVMVSNPNPYPPSYHKVLTMLPPQMPKGVTEPFGSGLEIVFHGLTKLVLQYSVILLLITF